MSDLRYSSPDQEPIFQDSLEQKSYLHLSNEKHLDISSRDSNRSRSGLRSRLNMGKRLLADQLDTQERFMQEELAKEEFLAALEELRNQDGVTEKDVEAFKKNAIIQKSIDLIKLRSYELAAVRNSPTRYSQVKSKVARCIKVQKNVSKKAKQQQNESNLGYNITQVNVETQHMFTDKKLNNALSVEQLGLTFNSKNSPWSLRYEQKLVEKEQLVKAYEEKLHQIQEDIQNRKLRGSKSSGRLGQSKAVPKTEPINKTKESEAIQQEISNFNVPQQEPAPIKIEEQKQVPEAIHVQSKTQGRVQSQNMFRRKNKEQVNAGLPQEKPKVAPVQPQVEEVQQQQMLIQANSTPPPQSQKQSVAQSDIQPSQLSSFLESDGGFGKAAHIEAQKRERESKFKNVELENRTNAIQDEFESLLDDLVKGREKRDTKGNFYKVMEEYYGTGENPAKHQSPTKRLVTLKNSTQEHKKVMKSNIERGEYSLTYCSSPGKSYIVEPHGGALNYDIAQKNPLKFYDQVFNQNITKHKMFKEEAPLEKRKSQISIKSKVTKRPYLKIMESIKSKLIQQLQKKIGEEFGENIRLAIQDKSIQQTIRILVEQDKIKLVNNEQVDLVELQEEQENEDLEQEQENEQLEQEQEDDSFVAEDLSENEGVEGVPQNVKTQLSIQEQAMDNIESEVRDHIRRNSDRPVNV